MTIKSRGIIRTITSGKGKDYVSSLPVGTKGEKTAFQRLLDSAEERFPSKQKLAEAIGITPSRYSRVYKGNAYSLNVLNCLRLATLARRPARDVLILAGKADVAELLDALYGQAPATTELAISPLEREAEYVRSIWPTAPADVRDPILKLLQYESRGTLESNATSRADAGEASRKATGPRRKQ